MASNTHHAAHARHDGTTKLGSLSDEITGMRESVTDGIQGVTDSGRRIVGAAGTTAKRALGDARDTGVEYKDRVAKSISERPLQSVAIAAAVGAAAMGIYMLMRRR